MTTISTDRYIKNISKKVSEKYLFSPDSYYLLIINNSHLMKLLANQKEDELIELLCDVSSDAAANMRSLDISLISIVNERKLN